MNGLSRSSCTARRPSPKPGKRVHFPGGHLDGCRIGFDLGASDYKVAAVIEGEAVYSEEIPWTPGAEADPEYHYRHIQDGLKKAAAHLPRVDAIGGSSAGIYHRQPGPHRLPLPFGARGRLRDARSRTCS